MHLVLVHGAGGAAATWDLVTPLLAGLGCKLTAVTNPLQSLEGDVAHTLAVIDSIPGDIVLVGHSYGGAVITNAGRHSRVRGLVYIAAFGPDAGESVDSIVAEYPPAESEAFASQNGSGEWITDRSGTYWDEIGPDLSPEQRVAMLAETRKCEEDVFVQESGKPAWRGLPTWYLLATADRNLRPEVQRFMAERMSARIVKVDSSHFTPRSAPLSIARLVETAVTALR